MSLQVAMVYRLPIALQVMLDVLAACIRLQWEGYAPRL